jgi:hypothetical protein
MKWTRILSIVSSGDSWVVTVENVDGSSLTETALKNGAQTFGMVTTDGGDITNPCGGTPDPGCQEITGGYGYLQYSHNQIYWQNVYDTLLEATKIISIKVEYKPDSPTRKWWSIVTYVDEVGNTRTAETIHNTEAFADCITYRLNLHSGECVTDNPITRPDNCVDLPYDPAWISNCLKLPPPIGAQVCKPLLPISTNETRWCVAVIDEDDSQTMSGNEAQWNSFRSNYPRRRHFVLEASLYPVDNTCQNNLFQGYEVTSVNGKPSSLRVPDNYKADLDKPYANWMQTVRTPCVDDWYAMIDARYLPRGSKIALFIDNSGSMTTSTVQNSYNLFVQKLIERDIGFFVVESNNESWIDVFNREFI